MQYISMTEYLMGRVVMDKLPEAHYRNMNKLVPLVNDLLASFGQYRKVVSGYRRPEDNAACGGAKGSAHMSCEAVDLEDKDGKLKEFCSPQVLEKHHLYMEHPSATKNWCHLQIRKPHSGARIFKP